ncbi:MAG: ATP-grasp fold amidoligase family protein [Anaerostipes sp.]|jgi:hypothetical protein
MASSKVLKKIKYTMRFIPDKAYIQIYYFAHFKKLCNLENPKTYNEKLNWLKLHDKNPLYTQIVDKYEAKEYVSNIIGDEYIIPTLGVWEHFEDIDFEALPNQFVLKCTHDSEGLVIVKDKSKLDKEMAKQKIEASLKQNFYYIGREWPYKDVKPRIIAEQYMEDHVDCELRDYKFFCFDGEPKAMFIASDRVSGHVKFDYFDLEFKHLDIKQKYEHADKPLRKPVTFDKMIDLSKILSEDFPHVRVDFYEVDGKLYFGELTFYHFSGFMPFEPKRWDIIFGNWIKLPHNHKK